MELLFPFSFGLIACFIGALPFGAINLTVVSLTVNRSYEQGMRFALGASLIEIGEAYIALIFGKLISGFINRHSELPYFIAFVFIGLGIYFFARKTSPKLEKNNKKGLGAFMQGVFVAILNPQAIPFWLFAFAFVTPNHTMSMGHGLVLFLAGVFTGKMLALLSFARMSNYLSKHLSQSCHTIDYIMGSVFSIIGIIQILKTFI